MKIDLCFGDYCDKKQVMNITDHHLASFGSHLVLCLERVGKELPQAQLQVLS